MFQSIGPRFSKELNTPNFQTVYPSRNDFFGYHQQQQQQQNEVEQLDHYHGVHHLQDDQQQEQQRSSHQYLQQLYRQQLAAAAAAAVAAATATTGSADLISVTKKNLESSDGHGHKLSQVKQRRLGYISNKY